MAQPKKSFSKKEEEEFVLQIVEGNQYFRSSHMKKSFCLSFRFLFSKVGLFDVGMTGDPSVITTVSKSAMSATASPRVAALASPRSG